MRDYNEYSLVDIESREVREYLSRLVYTYASGLTEYSMLMYQLFCIEFYSEVWEDDDRERNALELRREIDPNGYYLELMDRPVSVLEVLIELARTIDEDLLPREDGKQGTERWLMEMFINLGLEKYTDSSWDMFTSYDVFSKVGALLDREYDYSGVGGLFPLTDAKKDQRVVPLWYQLNEYLIEKYD